MLTKTSRPADDIDRQGLAQRFQCAAGVGMKQRPIHAAAGAIRMMPRLYGRSIAAQGLIMNDQHARVPGGVRCRCGVRGARPRSNAGPPHLQNQR